MGNFCDLLQAYLPGEIIQDILIYRIQSFRFRQTVLKSQSFTANCFCFCPDWAMISSICKSKMIRSLFLAVTSFRINSLTDIPRLIFYPDPHLRSLK